MIVMTFDEFAAQAGNFRFESDVALQRLPSTSRGQRARLNETAYQRVLECASRRKDLAVAYEEMYAKGDIRPPTRIELLLETASGHDDNLSVQAARRILERKGIAWTEGRVAG